MRIYIPLTVTSVNDDVLPTKSVFGVTDDLINASDPKFGRDEHEELARALAATQSLRFGVAEACRRDLDFPVRRIVASADVDEAVTPTGYGRVAVAQPVTWDDVVSIHIDDDDAATLWHEELHNEPPCEDVEAWVDQRQDYCVMDWYDITELDLVRSMCRLGVDSEG